VISSLLLLSALGCATRGEVVEHHTIALRTGTLAKVAVVPFFTAKGFEGEREGTRILTAKASADLVARFVAEAFTEREISTIAPSDVVLAFEGTGKVLPRQDPIATAALMAEQFGATAVVLGSVRRYRERAGQALGSNDPASVWFEFAIHTAPEGEKVWTARFDHTQLPLSEDLFITRRYPGRGSRWLTAGELARWGAGEAVSALPKALR
jgi:hypothetical protein